ncbi:hypothetical protein TVAG_490370 [Trichomonas vaginalis G3]|uniref:Uncharacterized protein n=1 Tax=Trichomonas vaginalis (strain ATCC PRA-98 / G3) TaxID=412133 RepID=A2F0X4_TRIV3|nr:tetratricopeptide repeat domain domain-containing protein [Trichomonas vaginalis G3]EAY01449.1 hypothetical protein TVAG_490370 [Trichomonas vaginalis G3]KAI5519258.1 tetratricopeptide repeat domain domain-containing protein [Trichomonas vaginalis G3]|eukprot:XP_001314153.1 hypothetical protein [Trichomonas vaginalis G3]
MTSQILVFFEGDKNWWVAYNVTEAQRIRYIDIISKFLCSLKEFTNQDYTIDQVCVFNFLPFSTEKEIIDDLKRQIKEPLNSTTEILVQVKDSLPIIKREKLSGEQALSFITKGRYFEEKGFYIDARDFFIAADEYGYLDLARLYYIRNLKEPVENLLPRLVELYPNNFEVQIMKIAYEKDEARFLRFTDDAFKYIRQLHGVNKFNFLSEFARILLSRHMYSRAQECINELKSINESHSVVCKLECELQIALKDPSTAAIMAFRSPQSYKYLARICDLDGGVANVFEKVFSSKDSSSQTIFSPKALADIGKTLFKKGNINCAVTFLREAYHKKPQIEICYQLLKIFHILHNKSQFFDILKSFIISNQTELIPGINFKDLMQIFANADYKIMPKTTTRQSFSTILPSHIPYLKLLMLITVFLYSFGNYSMSNDIRLKIRCYSSPLRTMPGFGYIRKLYFACDQPPPGSSRPSDTRIAFVGDEYVYAAGPIPNIQDDDKRSLKAEFFAFPGLSIKHLKKGDTNKGIHRSYNQQIKGILQNFNYVIFVFGTIDCIQVIPLSVQNLEYPKATQAVLDLVIPYAEMIKKYKEAQSHIYVHPAFSCSEEAQPITDLFNRLLGKYLKEPTYLKVEKSLPRASSPADSKGTLNDYHNALRRELDERIYPDRFK